MRITLIPKVGVSLAWSISAIAILMLLFVTDSYRRGYEDMVSDAATLFISAMGLAACATTAAVVMRRKNPSEISLAWTSWGIAHVVLSILFLAGVFALARLST